MLTRLAATFLSLALASSASARSFSQPPADGSHAVAAEQTDERALVRAALAARRAHNLASFHAYRIARVYPRNGTRVGPLNVWRDADGHLCAAATMIDRDGQHALVMATAKDHNTIRLLDVTDGPLLDWLMTSGFTLEEIDRIQRPMVRPVIDNEQEHEQETRRLAADYQETEKALTDHADEGLDLAVARLMTRPELVRALVASWSAQLRTRS